MSAIMIGILIMVLVMKERKKSKSNREIIDDYSVLDKNEYRDLSSYEISIDELDEESKQYYDFIKSITRKSYRFTVDEDVFIHLQFDTAKFYSVNFILTEVIAQNRILTLAICDVLDGYELVDDPETGQNILTLPYLFLVVHKNVDLIGNNEMEFINKLRLVPELTIKENKEIFLIQFEYGITIESVNKILNK